MENETDSQIEDYGYVVMILERRVLMTCWKDVFVHYGWGEHSDRRTMEIV